MATEGFENFQAVVTSLAAAGAGFVAWIGLHTWKEQTVWKANREIALAALKALRKLEQELKFARKQRFSASEMMEIRALHMPQSTTDGGEIDLEAYAHRSRLQKVHDCLVNCEAVFDEAFVLWGDLLERDWQQTKVLLNKFFNEADLHLYLTERQSKEDTPSEGIHEILKSIRDVVFAEPGLYEENEFSRSLRSAIDPLIAAVRSKVGRP